MNWRRAGAAGLLLGGSGCIGNIGDGPSASTNEPGVVETTSAFECTTDAVPPPTPLRRLSKAQYENTIRDLVTAALASEAEAVVATLEPLFASLPSDLPTGPDDRYGAFTRLDQTVHQEHIDATYKIATHVGEELISGPRLALVVGACAADGDESNDAGCLDDFIRRFGERAMRGPVSDDDVAFYRKPAGEAPYEPADYADVIGLLLESPRLVYFVDLGQDAAAGSATVPLTAYELASRLSYHFWQTLPDEALLDAARSGELLSESGYAAQIDRLFADPRTAQTLRVFFHEWLFRPDVEDINSRIGTPVFDAFASGLVLEPDLRGRMFDEVTDAALYTLETGGDFADFFSSRRSFAKDADLAAIYEVAPWDGTSEPPELTQPERAGLLTRAALLASGSAGTRPIMKGVFIRKALLCDALAPPPPNAAATKPTFSADQTTRETVEQLTEQPGSVCAGCHASQINPLGFATESFDALGRVRSIETLYDPETGEIVGEEPVDTSTVPHVEAGDDRPVDGSGDLAARMLESEKVEACLARHYIRFSFGRVEDAAGDGCTLVNMHQALLDGAPLAEVLRSIALDPSFRSRSTKGGSQ